MSLALIENCLNVGIGYSTMKWLESISHIKHKERKREIIIEFLVVRYEKESMVKQSLTGLIHWFSKFSKLFPNGPKVSATSSHNILKTKAKI